MKTNGLRLIVALALAFCGLVAAVTSTAAPQVAPARAALARPAPIIVDHTCTDISRIPDYWIEQARKLVVHYAHTSHGSQVLSGLEWLEGQDAKYNVDIAESGTVVLPSDPTALRIYDGNNYPYDTYITPEEYWESPDGISHTRSVINTGWFKLSTWTWCWQMSDYDTTQVQQYLNVMGGFEAEYPNVGFILMTGHTDGTGPGGTLYRNNDMVRQYARDHNMVLFDFADIETYDPLGGGPYLNNNEGVCTWCEGFCAAHPEYCADLPDYCTHSESLPQATLFCKLKGQAFWWLLARMAGWDGTPTDSLTLHATPADRAIRLNWEVNATLPPTSTWRVEYYTQTATLYTATDPYSTTRALTLTQNVYNYQWYTVVVHAMLGSTSLMSDTVRVMPTNRFVYLPVVMR